MKEKSVKCLKFEALWDGRTWILPAYVDFSENGTILNIQAARDDTGPVEIFEGGIAIPSFVNAHSHAFQYAMAGEAETSKYGSRQNFWSWRDLMYKVADNIGPDECEAIACMAYKEMLRHGYTHVVEFHYLQHDPMGHPYTNRCELALRHLNAANRVGMGITMIPVYYNRGGFGQAPDRGQQRFIFRDLDAYHDYIDDLVSQTRHYPGASVGVGAHSMRAVDTRDLMQMAERLQPDTPFHIHVAEQPKEVEDCLSYCGTRPVRWMLDHLPLDNRFNLVHATYTTQEELSDLASRGASVILCPSTEANLADGFFSLDQFMDVGGQWTIGSDSHIGLDPFEELRWLDYGRRLRTGERLHRPPGSTSCMASHLAMSALSTGRTAAGFKDGRVLSAGAAFDALILDGSHALLANRSPSSWWSIIIYASDATMKIGTISKGRLVIDRHRHLLDDTIHASFTGAMKTLQRHLIR